MADESLETYTKQYEELVRFLATDILGTEEFKVSGKVRGSQILLKLEAPANVRGRVIGRGGRVARSLRTILETAAIPTHLRPSLDIVD